MKLDPIRHLTNPLALLALLGVNLSANLLPLGGRTTGEVSALYPTLVTPAGWTFLIWLAIYVTLIPYVIWQMLPLSRTSSAVARIGPLFALSSLFNIAWLFAWHFLNLGLSLLLMFALLGTLILIYVRIRVPDEKPRGIERLAVRLPFSLYLAWVSFAVIANAAAWLAARGWSGWGLAPIGWALLLLFIAALLAALVLLLRNDLAWSLVTIWALAGVAAGQNHEPLVMIVSVILGVLLLAFASWRLFHARSAPDAARREPEPGRTAPARPDESASSRFRR